MRYRTIDWKYVLLEPYIECLARPLPLRGFAMVENPYFILRANTITVLPGYRWDGASGPTVDTTNSMRAGLIHDVLYQAMREGVLPPGFRRRADLEFRRILKGEGMNFGRRWAWYIAVRLFGKSSAKRKER